MFARWYAQMASFVNAGFTIERAVETATGLGAEKRDGLLQRLRAGDSLDQSIERGAPWIPDLDRQLIAAGEACGRLPEMFRRLADKHEERVGAGRRALMAALYPLAVAHFAVLAFPIKIAVIDGDLAGYAWTVFQVLVPGWVLGLGFFWAVRRQLRPAVVLLDLLPWVGGYRRARALADLAFVLEAQVVAGISLDIAWLQAVLAAGDRRLEPVAIAVADTVQRGEPVSVAITGRRELPPPFEAFWTNGEETGRLDESLKQLHRHFVEIASRKLVIASLVYPKVLFALIAIWVAIQILSFYAGYFRQFEEFM